MQIEQIDPSDADFLEFAKERNLFMQPHWLALFAEASLYALRKGNSIFAAFHIFRYTRLGIPFYINSPFSIHCGLELQSTAEKLVTRQSDQKRAMRGMAEYFKSLGSKAHIQMAFSSDWSDVQALQWAGFPVSIRYSYLFDLARPEADMLAAMSTERRKNIKQAGEKGYEGSWNKKPGAVLALIHDTLSKAGESYQADILEKLLLPENAAFVYSVLIEAGSVPMATCIIAVDSGSAYYIAGGHSSSGDSLAGLGSLAGYL